MKNTDWIESALPAHREPLGRRADSDIAHDVVGILERDPAVPERTIKARVQDQRVWLVGECDFDYQRVAAERALQGIAGVKSVINIVRLRPGRQ